MYIARIHHYNGKLVEVVAYGHTEHNALRNAMSRLLGRRISRIYVETPVRGADTRWVYAASRVGNSMSLGNRAIAHVYRP